MARQSAEGSEALEHSRTTASRRELITAVTRVTPPDGSTSGTSWTSTTGPHSVVPVDCVVSATDPAARVHTTRPDPWRKSSVDELATHCGLENGARIFTSPILRAGWATRAHRA